MPDRSNKQLGGATAESPSSATHGPAATNGGKDAEELLAGIRRLTAERGDDPEVDRNLLELRHRAGLALVARRVPGAGHPEPDFDGLEEHAGVPEVTRSQLSPELLRAAILRHGCLLVRGLIETDEAAEFRDEIDRAMAARAQDGGARDASYFHEFVPEPPYDVAQTRKVVAGPGAMWVADSPRVAAELLELLERAGFLEMANGYLGEHPAFSVHKSTLRRVMPNPDLKVPVSFWHQDGAFLGEVRALNLWLSLSHCGDIAPGLDVVPSRIEEILPTGTEGAFFDWSISQAVAEEAAGEAGIVRPIFESGDALLFDELSLHATALAPEMTDTRYAVECWFFGPSAFPDEYPPLAV